MLTSTVSDQGQTTVPASVRKALKAPPGTVLAWAVNGSSAEVVPLIKTNARKHSRIDYEALIRDWKESRTVPDYLLKIRRSKEP
jgi:bifunctional DNA-binding transcriptional regulator/antitoxin component of YhaV-PrlF toxin-antitoxin module